MEEKNMQEVMEKAQVLIEALPYIQRFNRKIIVVKYGGSAMIDEELKKHVIQDVTLLKLVGFKPIIVHGGGKEISRWVEKTGMQPEFVNGLRKTDAATMEIAEIHSMSMEHFAYPWMKDFFGEKADDYCYAHLAEALVKIPYMVAVDEFQHRVFEKPAMTAKERRAVWHELEKTYLPWRDYDGHPFLEEGGFWMQKQHIFLFPFYYIDYALAQICAIQFYGRAKKDRKKAWADYYRLCQAGGSKGYFDLLKLAELDNPFHEGTVKKTVDGLLEDLFK